MTTLHRTALAVVVPERTTARLTGTFRDESGAAIGSGRFASLVFTLYDRATDTIINSRSKVDVLNAGGGTVSGLGDFALDLTDADNAVLGYAEREEHVALFEYVYDSTRKGKSELVFSVANLSLVP